MFRYLIVIIGLATAGVAATAQELPTIELSAGIYRIEAEVANTESSRMIGLMRRQYMAPQHGMLFVFDADAHHCMWMRNTLIPLSVAFLDGHGRIINVEDMEAQTENNHCAAKPARFALEMNANWFSKRAIAAGFTIDGIKRAPPPR